MTICDIARLAGVSVATVSRVLNNKGYVKEETRKKIEKIIKEYNYHPNAVARSLIRNDTSMIGVIMPGRTNPFFADILDAVEMRAEAYGHSVLFYNTAEDSSKESWAIRQAIEHRVRGILILPVIGSNKETVSWLLEAERLGIPVVLIDREIPGGEFDGVVIDNKFAVYEGVKLLIETGHRKIGIVTCPEIVKEGRGRIDGYIQCLEDFGLPVEGSYIYKGGFDEESGYKASRQFLSLEDPPTAVFATCSSGALGCIRYMNEHHIRIGYDIGLIGFDDIAILNVIGYQLTVMDRAKREMGEMAYEMLAERMDGKKQGSHQEMIVNTKMIIRGSEQCCQCLPRE